MLETKLGILLNAKVGVLLTGVTNSNGYLFAGENRNSSTFSAYIILCFVSRDKITDPVVQVVRSSTYYRILSTNTFIFSTSWLSRIIVWFQQFDENAERGSNAIGIDEYAHEELLRSVNKLDALYVAVQNSFRESQKVSRHQP